MRVQTLFSTVLLSASAVLAAPVAEEAARLEARAATTAITGVPNNGQQVRMELRTMQRTQPDMFNIYLLGLQNMMAVQQSDPLSYYQIAGIHGRPYTPWDGVTSQGGSSGYGGGYCTHTSNLFLPWHRPYLALYEQALYKNIQAVVAKFPAGSANRAKYTTAAANFRIPYWDWAAPPCSGCNPYPLLVSNQYVSVTTPTGQQTILNPLFRYDFHPISSSDMVYNPFATWTVTKRDPTSWDANGVSQNNLVAPQISNNRVSFADRLYNLFTSYSNFTQFGNEAWITSTTANADSLESLHDAIHSITGSNGHMTYLDYAAFDPIFWLHHAMIDRCFAMWQALYPNSYVEAMAAVGSTYTYPAGTVQDVNSALPPFHKDTNGGNWQSSTVRDIKTFGYTYPELQSGKAADVRTAINQLYGSTAGSSTSSKPKRSVVNDVSAAAGVQHAATNNANSYQYVVNAVSQKFAMNGSYAIYFFMGDYSSDPSQWSTDPNLVGTHAVFANLGSATAAVKRAMNQDLKITGSVPLTTMLVSKVASGDLASLKPSDVEVYLTTNLHWRIAMYDGTVIKADDVPDLSVTVVSAEVQPAASASDFPTWSTYTPLTNCTIGRAGGHKARYWNSAVSKTITTGNHILRGIDKESWS